MGSNSIRWSEEYFIVGRDKLVFREDYSNVCIRTGCHPSVVDTCPLLEGWSVQQGED